MTLAVALVLATQVRVLTLADAVQTATTHQPQLKQAQAAVDIARARVGEARAALLPQLTGTGSYQRTTANFAPRPGILPTQINMMQAGGPTFATFDFFSFGLTLSQYLWDFRAPFAYRATRATAEAQSDLRLSTYQQVLLTVRANYFNARAQRALAAVARDNLANQTRHLVQIRGFVEEGVRPEIDLAQAETDEANAQVQLINASNAYEVAKAQLNQAMGVEQGTDYDVADDTFPPVDGEDQPLQALFDEAVKARPDLLSVEQQVRAQRSILSATKSGYGPSFGGTMSLTDVGTSLDRLVWNWNTTLTANWALFDGLLTYSQVKEASANLRGISAQRDLVRQQVLLDVSQAQLQVRAAKAGLVAAGKAMVSARLQLKLAEGRYEQGVGSVIELGDAQLAATQAAAQNVQAEYNLAAARAQLLRALGRS